MDYIKQGVERTICEYETNDPYHLARVMGMEVDEFPFRRIKGFILEVGGKALIVFNSRLPEWLKRVVPAHELGHGEHSHRVGRVIFPGRLHSHGIEGGVRG